MSTPIKFPVRLRLSDPSFEDEEGRLYPGDLDAEGEAVWTNVDACCHDYSICFNCLRQWLDGGVVGEVVIEIDGVEQHVPLESLLDMWESMEHKP